MWRTTATFSQLPALARPATIALAAAFPFFPISATYPYRANLMTGAGPKAMADRSKAPANATIDAFAPPAEPTVSRDLEVDLGDEKEKTPPRKMRQNA
jgi:hypothetical protein